MGVVNKHVVMETVGGRSTVNTKTVNNVPVFESMANLTEEELQALYAWIDEIPLSRQKKNISRDFSDGVLAAEVVHHFLPKLVELHNYSPANSTQQKIDNWRTINRKVFSRLHFSIPDEILENAANSKPGVVEFILSTLRVKVEKYLEDRSKKPSLAHGYDTSVQYYDPNQMVSTYNAGPEPWSQDPYRHPGPLGYNPNGLPNPMMYPGTTYNGSQPQDGQVLKRSFQNGERMPSKIPVFGGVKHFDDVHKKSSFSAPSRISNSLPPIVGARGDKGGGQNNSRGQEKGKKYAQNPRVAPPLQPKDREGTTGVRLKLAEKDQRILESQEYIQFLQMKVTRLEHLVNIKDMKIAELKRQIEMNNMARHNQLRLHQHPLQRR